MSDIVSVSPSRKQILIRLLFTIFYLIVFEIIKTIVQIATLFQYVYLLIFKKQSEPVKTFSNKVCTYTYHVLRYITLNQQTKPYPLSQFPEELRPPEAPVKFE
jgi:hypothetical protein